VFAPATKAAKHKVRGGERKAAPRTTSAHAKSSDLWRGFKPQDRASVFAADAKRQRSRTALAAVFLALALGAVSLVGCASVLALRPRRAAARSASRRRISK
jgi:hypothetical protein